jgi:hypothetical protein
MTDQEALAIYRNHKLCDCEVCKLARTVLKAMDERLTTGKVLRVPEG